MVTAYTLSLMPDFGIFAPQQAGKTMKGRLELRIIKPTIVLKTMDQLPPFRLIRLMQMHTPMSEIA